MNERFTKWLQKAMDDAGLTQTELARQSDLYPSNISGVMSGDKEPGVNFLIKIAKGLRLPPGYVFEQYASPAPEKLNRDQLLAAKVSEAINLFTERGHGGDVQLIYEFAEMLLRRQGASLPAPVTNTKGQLPEVGPPRSTYKPMPGDEHIMELLKMLDTYRQRQVYDFARWQLKEQYSVVNSSGERSAEQKQKEWQEAIGLIDLMLAVEDVTPEEREDFMLYLIERYKALPAARPRRPDAPRLSASQ